MVADAGGFTLTLRVTPQGTQTSPACGSGPCFSALPPSSARKPRQTTLRAPEKRQRRAGPCPPVFSEWLVCTLVCVHSLARVSGWPPFRAGGRRGHTVHRRLPFLSNWSQLVTAVREAAHRVSPGMSQPVCARGPGQRGGGPGFARPSGLCFRTGLPGPAHP